MNHDRYAYDGCNTFGSLVSIAMSSKMKANQLAPCNIMHLKLASYSMTFELYFNCWDNVGCISENITADRKKAVASRRGLVYIENSRYTINFGSRRSKCECKWCPNCPVSLNVIKICLRHNLNIKIVQVGKLIDTKFLVSKIAAP